MLEPGVSLGNGSSSQSVPAKPLQEQVHPDRRGIPHEIVEAPRFGTIDVIAVGPDLPFISIGDSAQRALELYLTAADHALSGERI